MKNNQNKTISGKNNPSFPILIIDDEKRTLEAYKLQLLAEDFDNVITCTSAKKAMKIMGEKLISVVLLDLYMPGINGEEFLDKSTSEYPDVPVIIVTVEKKAEIAVRCMKKGAFDFLTKPVDPYRLITVINHALEITVLRNENLALHNDVDDFDLTKKEYFNEIITGDKKILSIFKYIESIARTKLPVLITGETGVGKELFARAINKASGRRGEFVSVNVAGLDDNNFSDTLFGHTKGAFTGADKSRKGLVERASGGTLFLDEIGDLAELSQVKLLRLIQEREYYTLGSDSPSKSDARILTATNHNLQAMQKKGKFRKDLFYRLNLHHIHIPSLRERPNDIKIIGEYFIRQAVREFNIPAPEIPDNYFDIMMNYDFPGNVRELQSLIFDNLSSPEFGTLSTDQLTRLFGDDFSEVKSDTSPLKPNMSLLSMSGPELPSLKEVEEELIGKALSATHGNMSKAAKILGISRVTLHRKLKK